MIQNTLRTIVSAHLLFGLVVQAFAEESDKEETAVTPTAEERRQAIDAMRSDVLGRLFENISDAREVLEASQGYAIFSKKGMNLLMISTARGVGILRDHRDGSDTYMKAFGAGTGVGAGLKNYSAVIIFKTESALDDFVEKGWELTGQADAHGDSGQPTGEPVKEMSKIAGPDVQIYQMTESGFALQALIQGFRYWPDRELNQ